MNQTVCCCFDREKSKAVNYDMQNRCLTKLTYGLEAPSNCGIILARQIAGRGAARFNGYRLRQQTSVHLSLSVQLYQPCGISLGNECDIRREDEVYDHLLVRFRTDYMYSLPAAPLTPTTII